jgi:hypothetical protein
MGRTGLHWAAALGLQQVAELLLAEADRHAAAITAAAAAAAAAAADADAAAAEVHQGKGVERPPELLDFQDKHGNTALHLAARYCQPGTLSLLLGCSASASALVKHRNKAGLNVLHMAAVGGNEECVAAVVAKVPGAADAHSRQGLTAAQLAAKRGHVGVLTVLERGTKQAKQEGGKKVRPSTWAGGCLCMWEGGWGVRAGGDTKIGRHYFGLPALPAPTLRYVQLTLRAAVLPPGGARAAARPPYPADSPPRVFGPPHRPRTPQAQQGGGCPSGERQQVACSHSPRWGWGGWVGVGWGEGLWVGGWVGACASVCMRLCSCAPLQPTTPLPLPLPCACAAGALAAARGGACSASLNALQISFPPPLSPPTNTLPSPPAPPTQKTHPPRVPLQWKCRKPRASVLV